MTRRGAAALGVLTMAIGTLALSAPQTPSSSSASVEAVLGAATAYVRDYERAVSGVIAEEDYLQEVPSQRPRRLRSDLLVIQDDAVGWVEFRDVFAVDGRNVRDRRQRLAQLFEKPSRDRLQQAQRITDEGARFNLNPRGRTLQRTINTPLIALRFLRPADWQRSAFEIDAAQSVEPGDAVILTFKERAMPRIIRTPDSVAAEGAFWVERGSGRITDTMLSMRSRDTSVTIGVTYREDPRLKLWLPTAMVERYVLGGTETITGHAEYSNFRQFRVDTTTDIGR